MQASADWVNAAVAAIASDDPRPIYGINTGFGALAGREAFGSSYHARLLSRNLLVSHATGTGDPLDYDVIRAGLLIRAHQLAKGRSGIRIQLVNRLLGLLGTGAYPIVPRMGSLGASGDLAPLAHLALLLSRPPEPGPEDTRLPVDDDPGEAWLPMGRASGDGALRDETLGTTASGDELAGEVASVSRPADADHLSRDWLSGGRRRWRRVSGVEALEPLGGQLELEAKEGLALINGATLSAALASLACADALRILQHAELALAMSLEANRGFRDPFLPLVHDSRPFAGAAASARRLLARCEGSTLLDPAAADRDPVRVPPQDPYSLRCAPQVMGAAGDALAWVRATVETEINSAVDNPLIFLELERAYKAVSGGNFHGAPLAHGLDLIKIVMTDLAGICERRVFNLCDHRLRDPEQGGRPLPAFLIRAPEGLIGLNSGMMIAQYTAASLVSACKTLAHPDSVDSIPSSANQEDHVSMSMNAGLHARQLLEHVEGVVAIELMVAAQALDLRADEGRPGRGVAAVHARLRQEVAHLAYDRSMHRDIEKIRYLMRGGSLLEADRAATEGLG
jgi:histidine ammonia-lyase